MRIPLPGWSEGRISVPTRLEICLKEQKAEALGREYVRRSRLEQRLVKRVAEKVGPERQVRSVEDSNYATQYFLQDLPENACVVGRMPKKGALYRLPEPKLEGKPGPGPRVCLA